jgi:import inner membrane translocase subunit TIM22
MTSDLSTSVENGASPSPQTDHPQPTSKSKNKFSPIALPTAEQMMMEDVMGNCFVKTGLSGIMGGLAGVAFGLFSASMENAHGVSSMLRR